PTITRDGSMPDEETEPGALIDCVAERAARFNLGIDWGVQDPTGAAFLARVSPDALLEPAHDQLRLDGYTLWTWQTGTDARAGWRTQIALPPRPPPRARRTGGRGGLTGGRLRPFRPWPR